MKQFKTDILDKAEENIHGERVKDYGPASESFGKVAVIAAVLTGFPLTARNVLQVMQSAKLIRNLYSPLNDDHRIDLCGYVGLEDEVIKDAETERLKAEQLKLEFPPLVLTNETQDELLYRLAAIIAERYPRIAHNTASAALRKLVEVPDHG